MNNHHTKAKRNAKRRAQRKPSTSRSHPHKAPRQPRSYTPISDALSQPLTFADTGPCCGTWTAGSVVGCACYQWKQWKIYHRRKAELVKLGVPEEVARATAWSAKGPWRLSYALGVQMALNQRFFDSQGLPRLAAQ